MTSTLTTVFSAFSSFGLTAVSAWFASERFVFNRHKGEKWLAEILDDVSATSYRWVKKTAPEKSMTALTWSARIVRRATTPLGRMSAIFGRSSGSAGSADSVKVESSPPLCASPVTLPSTAIMAPRSDLTVQLQLGHKEERNSDEHSGRPSDASPVASPTTSPSSPEPKVEISAARARFMDLVQRTIRMNKLIGIRDEAKERVSSSLIDGKATDRKSVAIVMPRSSRVAGLVPKLQSMGPTQDIAAHTALVKHMQVSANQVTVFAPVVNHIPQFSPDGKFLATSSWDRTSVIFHVGVCLIGASLRCTTEQLVRKHSLPTARCCIPPDSVVKLHGKSGPFGKQAS